MGLHPLWASPPHIPPSIAHPHAPYVYIRIAHKLCNLVLLCYSHSTHTHSVQLMRTRYERRGKHGSAHTDCTDATDILTYCIVYRTDGLLNHLRKIQYSQYVLTYTNPISTSIDS